MLTKKFRATVARLLAMLLALLPFSCASDKERLIIENDVTKWYEVPDVTVNEIETNPLSGNFCKWQVATVAGKLSVSIGRNPYQLWARRFPGDFNGSDGYAILPDKVQEVVDGWLAAYNYVEDGRIYWFSSDMRSHRLIASGRINQFVQLQGSDDIVAAIGKSESGYVIRFHPVDSDNRWAFKKVVDYDFGDVIGVGTSDDDVILVCSVKGWWQITPDNTVEAMDWPMEVFGNASSIAVVERKIFVGGEYFVREIDKVTKSVRVLAPSEEFVQAMRYWSSEKFAKNLLPPSKNS